jgi:hypothetical protein
MCVCMCIDKCYGGVNSLHDMHLTLVFLHIHTHEDEYKCKHVHTQAQHTATHPSATTLSGCNYTYIHTFTLIHKAYRASAMNVFGINI